MWDFPPEEAIDDEPTIKNETPADDGVDPGLRLVGTVAGQMARTMGRMNRERAKPAPSTAAPSRAPRRTTQAKTLDQMDKDIMSHLNTRAPLAAPRTSDELMAAHMLQDSPRGVQVRVPLTCALNYEQYITEQVKASESKNTTLINETGSLGKISLAHIVRSTQSSKSKDSSSSSSSSSSS